VVAAAVDSVACFDRTILRLVAAAVDSAARFGLDRRIALHLVATAVELAGSVECSGRINHQSAVVGFGCSVQIILPRSAYLIRTSPRLSIRIKTL